MITLTVETVRRNAYAGEAAIDPTRTGIELTWCWPVKDNREPDREDWFMVREAAEAALPPGSQLVGQRWRNSREMQCVSLSYRLPRRYTLEYEHERRSAERRWALPFEERDPRETTNRAGERFSEPNRERASLGIDEDGFEYRVYTTDHDRKRARTYLKRYGHTEFYLFEGPEDRPYGLKYR